MRRGGWFVGAVLAAVVLGARPAEAQITGGYVSAMFGTTAGGKSDASSTTSGTVVGQARTYTNGRPWWVSGGYIVKQSGMGIDVEYASDGHVFKGSDFDGAKLSEFSVDFSYGRGTKRLRVYGLVGIILGGHISGLANSDGASNMNFSPSFGGGVMTKAAKHLGITVDVRYLRNRGAFTGNVNSQLGIKNLRFWRIGAGVFIPL